MRKKIVGLRPRHAGHRSLRRLGWLPSSALFWLALIIFCLPANAKTLDELRVARQALLKQWAQSQQAAKEKEGALNHLSTRIQELKQKQARQPLLLRGYRLQSLLASAQEMSQHLQELRQKATAQRQDVEKNRIQLLSALDSALDREAAQANQVASETRRKEAAKKLAQLTQERASLGEPENAALPSTTAGLNQVPENAEEAADRLRAVEDFQGRLQEEVTSLRKEIAQAKRQNFMRQEIGHLLEEEAFFGERGFIHGSGSRAKDDPSTALAKTTAEKADSDEAASSETSPAGDPSAAAPDESEVAQASTDLPAPGDEVSGETTPPSDSVPAAETPPSETLETAVPLDNPETLAAASEDVPNVEAQGRLEMPSALDVPLALSSDAPGRDPLAQLASEFGLELENTQNLGVHANPSPAHQVQMLQHRLQTTRAILRELEKLAGELRSRLHTP